MFFAHNSSHRSSSNSSTFSVSSGNHTHNSSSLRSAHHSFVRPLQASQHPLHPQYHRRPHAVVSAAAGFSASLSSSKSQSSSVSHSALSGVVAAAAAAVAGGTAADTAARRPPTFVAAAAPLMHPSAAPLGDDGDFSFTNNSTSLTPPAPHNSIHQPHHFHYHNARRTTSLLVTAVRSAHNRDVSPPDAEAVAGSPVHDTFMLSRGMPLSGAAGPAGAHQQRIVVATPTTSAETAASSPHPSSGGRVASRNDSNDHIIGEFVRASMNESDMPPGLMRFLQGQKQQGNSPTSATPDTVMPTTTTTTAEVPAVVPVTVVQQQQQQQLPKDNEEASRPLVPPTATTTGTPPAVGQQQSQHQQQTPKHRMLPRPSMSSGSAPNLWCGEAAGDHASSKTSSTNAYTDTPAMLTAAPSEGHGSLEQGMMLGHDLSHIEQPQQQQQQPSHLPQRPRVMHVGDLTSMKGCPLGDAITRELTATPTRGVTAAGGRAPPAPAPMNYALLGSTQSSPADRDLQQRRLSPSPPSLLSPDAPASGSDITSGASSVAAAAATTAHVRGRRMMDVDSKNSSRCIPAARVSGAVLSRMSTTSLPSSACATVQPPRGSFGTSHDDSGNHGEDTTPPSAVLYRHEQRVSRRRADFDSHDGHPEEEEVEENEEEEEEMGRFSTDSPLQPEDRKRRCNGATTRRVPKPPPQRQSSSRYTSAMTAAVTNTNATSMTSRATMLSTLEVAGGSAPASLTTTTNVNFTSSLVESAPLLVHFASVVPSPPATTNPHYLHHNHFPSTQTPQNGNETSPISNSRNRTDANAAAAASHASTRGPNQTKTALLVAGELVDAPPLLQLRHEQQQHDATTARASRNSSSNFASRRPPPVVTATTPNSSVSGGASLLNDSAGGMNFVHTPPSPTTALEPPLMAGVGWLDSFSPYGSVTSPLGTQNTTTTTNFASTVFSNSMTHSVGVNPAAAAALGLPERSLSRFGGGGGVFGSPSQSATSRQRRPLTATTTTTNTSASTTVNAAAAAAMSGVGAPVHLFHSSHSTTVSFIGGSSHAMAVPSAPLSSRFSGRQSGPDPRTAPLTPGRSASYDGSIANSFAGSAVLSPAAMAAAAAAGGGADQGSVVSMNTSSPNRRRLLHVPLSTASPPLADLPSSRAASPPNHSSAATSVVSFMRTPSTSAF